jgi:hypothetical protein
MYILFDYCTFSLTSYVNLCAQVIMLKMVSNIIHLLDTKVSVSKGEYTDHVLPCEPCFDLEESDTMRIKDIFFKVKRAVLTAKKYHKIWKARGLIYIIKTKQICDVALFIIKKQAQALGRKTVGSECMLLNCLKLWTGHSYISLSDSNLMSHTVEAVQPPLLVHPDQEHQEQDADLSHQTKSTIE